MTDFTTTQDDQVQEHWYIVEVDLPIITGLCEITPGVEGFGTPRSCPIQDGTSATATKTYTFGTSNTPIDIPISPVYRCLSGITENGTELQSGRGLAFRGRATINFVDFPGEDPNEERAAGLSVADQGTFLGKWKSRNVFENKEVRIKKGRVSPTFNYSTDFEVTTYLGRELNSNGTGRYTLECADALSQVEFDQSQFPVATGGYLTEDMDETQTTFGVDNLVDWEQEPRPYNIIIGDELMTVLSVANNQTSTASLTVKQRGIDIGTPEFAEFLSKVRVSEHDTDDVVQICYTADDKNVGNVFWDITQAVDIPGSLTPLATWIAETDRWLEDSNMSTIIFEVRNTNDYLSQMSKDYMLDMWQDPIENIINLKAVSQFQVATTTLTEGIEVDFESIKIKELEGERYSRALISYDKPYLADTEENTSYRKKSLAIRPELEAAEFYGKEKLINFQDSPWLNKSSAELRTVRYLQRYGETPQEISWKTQERFRTFKVGDVVNLVTYQTQGFDGLPDTSLIVQITKLQPVLTLAGRYYNVQSLSYFDVSDLKTTLINGVELNLFTLAGAPPDPVNYRFILDTGQFSSTDVTIPSIVAGGFAAGTQLTITLINGADYQSRGGDGRENDSLTLAQPGGTCYDAQGIDTDIYLGGTDPFGVTASGFLRAPGGGGGGTPDGNYFYTEEFYNAGNAVVNDFLSGGITAEGEISWVLLNDVLYQYNQSGQFTSTTIRLKVDHIGLGTNRTPDVIWDGSFFWALHILIGVIAVIVKYDKNGDPIGSPVNVFTEAENATCLAFDNDVLYIGDTDALNPLIYRYDLVAGTMVLDAGFPSFNVGTQLTAASIIAASADYVYVTLKSGGPETVVFLYDLLGVYTGTSFDTIDQTNGDFLGMTHNEFGLSIITDKTNNPVFNYALGGAGGGAGIRIGNGFRTQTDGNGDFDGNGGQGTTTFISATPYDSGDGGDWGQPGQDGQTANGYTGGLAGKGIVKGGAVVRVFGDTPTNFINGGGDTPDP